jgi:hypothetical protein
MRGARLVRLPPDKALQLASHSAFRSTFGGIWHRTSAPRRSSAVGTAAEAGNRRMT